MSDPLLFQTPDDGDITYINGQLVIDERLDTAVYLSLFGGNDDDSGDQSDNAVQWWGNLGETEPARTYRCATQNLLLRLAASAANLLRVEDAARGDLQWLIDEELATSVDVVATIPALNRINIVGTIVLQDSQYPFKFEQPWERAA